MPTGREAHLGFKRETRITTVRIPLRRTTVSEALAAVAEFPVRAAHIERVSLDRAEGRILAETVRAREDVPAFDRSMVDGFAVVADEVRKATRLRPVQLRVAGEVAMGHAPNMVLRPGCAVAVPTGGALPDGATGVVKIEDTQAVDGFVAIFDGVEAEDRITRRASDVAEKDHLFDPGFVLDPAAVGLLAAAGVESVEVFSVPRIGVLITGDELVPPGAPLRLGQIRESNGVTISSALSALGFFPQRYERVADDRSTFARALVRALAECDGVIISGGSSVGEKDYTPELVASAGRPGVIVHGVRAKPGRPVLLGMVGDQPVVGLPGNPVSALVMFETLAKPILLRMFDKEDTALPLRARLERTIDLEPNLEYRIPVALVREQGDLIAKPLLGTSSQLHILAFADALIVVPEGVGRVPADTWVDALPLTRTRNLR